MIIGDRDSVVDSYWAIGARHLAPGQLVGHGLDPQRVDPAEGVGRGAVLHARARLTANVAVLAHCA